MGERVIIASAALRSALGSDKGLVADALCAGDGQAENLGLEYFGGRDYLYYPVAGAPPLKQEGRLYSLLDSCVEEALSASSLPTELLHAAALFVGSSSFTIGEEEQRLERESERGSSTAPFPHSSCGDVAQHLAQRFSIQGGTHSFNTACTSSANALLYAQQAVSCGKVPAALVVGVECFNYTTLFGFDSLQLLSHDKYRPFDLERNGLVLGEGVGAVVITSSRQIVSTAEWGDVAIIGGDNGCDPNGMTCSSSDSMAQVIAGALKNAKLECNEISLIKAHATGSESNDAAEAMAMRQQFGEKLPDFTAIKGALGHTLGASGVVELIALTACLRRGHIPLTSGFSSLDEELAVSPLLQSKPFAGGPVMLNYFGFGGNNTSLILSLDSDG